MSKLETKDDVANWVLINLKRCKKEVQVVAVAKILQGFDRDQINQALSMSGVIERSASIADVKNGKVIIDMRGSEKWGKKVNRLFEILKQAAPKKEKMPAYSFAPFYYCKDGYWYQSNWRESGSVPVLDIVD